MTRRRTLAANPEHAEIIRAVDDVLGDLRAGQYTSVRGRLCQDYVTRYGAPQALSARTARRS